MTNRSRTASLMVAVASLTLGACSTTSYQLADRSTEESRREEQRLTTLLEKPGIIVVSGADCRVRLLGVDDDVSYAWARCSGDNDEGASLAVRVKGDVVELPGMGTEYAPSVERLFPDGLADMILSGELIPPPPGE